MSQRPLFGGISVGSAGFSNAAGTLGLVVKGTGTNSNNYYVLSNAHVLAMNSKAHFLKIGTAVWQPGGADGGSSLYKIGVLSKYTTIMFCRFLGYRCSPNYADAAIGKLDPGVQYEYGKVLGANNIDRYPVSGTTNVVAGDLVRKSGRTSGVTPDVLVQNPGASVIVSYTNSKQALFADQIITSVMSKPGDSGSAVDKGGQFVGLLYAGSDTITVVCKAQYIPRSAWNHGIISPFFQEISYRI